MRTKLVIGALVGLTIAAEIKTSRHQPIMAISTVAQDSAAAFARWFNCPPTPLNFSLRQKPPKI
ncbi:MAG: hypothetical protein ACP5N9_02085 [Candidatus Bilamarchaeum sp.]|jgi:hypothetical protein